LEWPFSKLLFGASLGLKGTSMIVVARISDLRALGQNRSVNGLLSREPITLALPDIDDTRRVLAAEALNRFQSRCGCEAGAAVTLAALAGGLWLAARVSPQPLSFVFVFNVALALVSAFVIGLIAKLAAMAMTRLEFSRFCRLLARDLGG
jgi:hypothetical protein